MLCAGGEEGEEEEEEVEVEEEEAEGEWAKDLTVA